MAIQEVEIKEIQGWDKWAEKYKPIPNKFSKHNELMYETFGEELEFIKTVNNAHVWTWVQGDMSDLIVAGISFVNRLGYYVTEVPWTDIDEYVLLSVELECDCYSEDDDVMESRSGEYGDPDCDKCEGAGLYTEYVG